MGVVKKEGGGQLKLQYFLDARLKRTEEQRGKKERGTEIPTSMRVFGDDDKHKVVELKVVIGNGPSPLTVGPVYFPLEELEKIVKAEVVY